MSKILKATIEYDDKIFIVEGEEAEKWQENNESVASIAYVHGMNAFDSNPIKWQVIKKWILLNY